MNVTVSGRDYTLSGVAPGAWLMNYRTDLGSGSLIESFDELAKDLPNISSNSWGFSPVLNSKYELFETLVWK